MDIKNINNINQLVTTTRLFMMSLDSYMSKLDLMRNSLEVSGSGYSYGTVLSTWTYHGIAIASNYLIFETTIPEDFSASIINTMYYSLYNMKNLIVYPLGELTTPIDYGLADTNIPLWWGYSVTKIYLYIPTDGLIEDKYSFWLPLDYIDEEYNIFFNRAHTFYLDYEEV